MIHTYDSIEFGLQLIDGLQVVFLWALAGVGAVLGLVVVYMGISRGIAFFREVGDLRSQFHAENALRWADDVQWDQNYAEMRAVGWSDEQAADLADTFREIERNDRNA